jgi:hypothetical protein
MLVNEFRDISYPAITTRRINFHIVHRASKLGVSFGKTEAEIALSVKTLKDVEKDRSLLMSKNNLNLTEDDPQNLFVSKVSGLCENLTEEESVGYIDHTDLDNKTIMKKRGVKKSLLKNLQVRRSSRIRKNHNN